ncbi:DPP IV N-terminal domain-containing protein [Nanoarchaeota archaeon]
MNLVDKVKGLGSFLAGKKKALCVFGSAVVFTLATELAPSVYAAEIPIAPNQNLTKNKSADEFPAFSPDGKKIAFSSNRDGNYEIYTMDVHGSKLERLTNSSGDDICPSWSPRGKKIAFLSNRDKNWEVYVMDPNGKKQVNLTNTPEDDSVLLNPKSYQIFGHHIDELYLFNRIYPFKPSWSSDGRKIAFSRGTGVYVINSKGGGEKNMPVHIPGDEVGLTSFRPIWSPRGNQLAFEGELYLLRESSSSQYYGCFYMSAGGSDTKKVTDKEHMEKYSDSPWSRDGRKLAFALGDRGNSLSWEIFITSAGKGSGIKRLTNNTRADFHPIWSPKGNLIAFQGRNRDESTWDIYVMYSNGKNETRVVNNPANDYSPVWSPDGKRIAFVSDRDKNKEIYMCFLDLTKKGK